MKDWHALERVNDKEVAGRQQAKTHRNLLENLVMQLRKCCLHPFLFEGAEADIATTTCEELVGASGKLSVLDMLLRSLFKKGHRCVLFSQFTRVLDILEDYCRMRGWKYCRLDGGTARAKRNFLVEQFNADPGPFFIFLMSTRSGGVGLNLQSADTCILYDSDVSVLSSDNGYEFFCAVSNRRILLIFPNFSGIHRWTYKQWHVYTVLDKR